MSTGKPNNLCDLLYCDSHFIAVVGHQTHNISKVCLYIDADYNYEKHMYLTTGKD